MTELIIIGNFFFGLCIIFKQKKIHIMKTGLFFFALLLVVGSAQATIFRLGYTGTHVAGIDFGYNDFYTAQNNAVNGDTIQVYQQTNTIGANYNVSKSLTILGFGHSLNANTGLQVQNRIDSSLNSIGVTFSDGSAGSSIQGLNLSGVTINTGGITITRCRLKGANAVSSYDACGTSSPFLYPQSGGTIQIYPSTNQDINNVTINGCFFDVWQANAIDLYWYYYYNNNSTNINNLIVTNNYFNGTVNLKTSVNGQVNGVFANNIMNYKFQHLSNVHDWNNNDCTEGFFSYYTLNASNYMISNFDYFLIKNNIFNTADTVTCPLNAPNSIIQNNVFTNAAQYACTGFKWF